MHVSWVIGVQFNSVSMCPNDVRWMESRASRYQLSLTSTSPDVGQSRLIWHPNATNTAAPISTITDIDCGRCGLIEAHLAYHRNEHGRADIDYHRYRHRPMWVNRGSFGIPSHIRHTIVHLTSNVACGGLRPPHPRCCALCVPLRVPLRPRPYGLRNDAGTLSSLVTLLRP